MNTNTRAASESIDPLIPDLNRYARFLCDNPDHSPELVQEAITCFLARQKNHGEITHPRKYLFSILYNLHCDLLQRQGRAKDDINIDDTDLADSRPSPEQRLTYLEIIQKIDRLPPLQQEILRCVIEDDLTYADIGAALQIPPGTVMSRLSRARQALRSALNMKAEDSIAALFEDND